MPAEKLIKDSEQPLVEARCLYRLGSIQRDALKLKQALCRLGAPAEDQGLGKRLGAPVVIIAGEYQLVAALPSLNLVRAGANGFLEDVAGCTGGVQVL